MRHPRLGSDTEVVESPEGRSQFDRFRWRCRNGEGDTCGVWRSATSRESAYRSANTHLHLHHGGQA